MNWEDLVLPPSAEDDLRLQIAIPLYDRFTSLDAVGPYQVMTHLPGAQIIFCAERPRGVCDESATLTLAAEVVDWRRFPAARAFMGFTGLCPSEHSSGDTASRWGITKAGPHTVRTALVESALAYRHPPAIGAVLRRRQRGASPDTLARSWKAQRRLLTTRTGLWT